MSAVGGCVTQEDTQQTEFVTSLNNATPVMALYGTAVLSIEPVSVVVSACDT